MRESERSLHERVASGSRDDRWDLAGREDLPESVYGALAESHDLGVLASLTQNVATPHTVLRHLAARTDEIGERAKLNPSAPIDLKDDSPLGSHSYDSVAKYLEARSATADQRREFLKRYERSPHPGGDRLGDVWHDVSTTIPGKRA